MSATEVTERGLASKAFGPDVVGKAPALLGEVDVPGLVRDLAGELEEFAMAPSLEERPADVRPGDGRLPPEPAVRCRTSEMYAPFRQTEAAPHSGRCNYGCPTHVELKLAGIERLFAPR